MHKRNLLILALLPVLVTPALGTETPVADALNADLPFGTIDENTFFSFSDAITLPDDGKTVHALAEAAPGGAFDPGDLDDVDPEVLGYDSTWLVERYPFYNLDWDITGLRLESEDPSADDYPWLVIINGGSANIYEFFVDLENKAGWGQYLAQKLNVLIVTIPGNFANGGWDEPPEERKAAYLLDTEMSDDEHAIRTAIYTNELIMEGLRKLVEAATEDDDELFIIGHSTSGELAFLAKTCDELGPRLKDRFLGWGSGGPARVHALRRVEQPDFYQRERAYVPVQEMGPRSAAGYVRSRYVGPMNPLYEDGMTDLELAEAWFEAEKRRRPMFKQPLQNHEHNTMIEWKGLIEMSIEEEAQKTGNAFNIPVEEVYADLMSSHYATLIGYDKMLWIVAREDRNHWLPEDKLNGWEMFIAKTFRQRNPEATIRVLELNMPMTHYGHVEVPAPLAAVFVEAVKWLTD